MAGQRGRDQVKAMARLARILAVLDNAGSVGATTEQLLKVADYGEKAPADQLSTDFRNLRRQGWQIDNVAGPGQPARYRMVSGDNRLRIKLNSEQLAALQRAVILSKRSDLASRLGVPQAELPPGVGSEILPHDESDELSLALQAVQLRSRVRFSYKGTLRVLHPASVRFQNNAWYLSGILDGETTVKNFAVTRMSQVSLDQPHTAEAVPEQGRLTLHPLRWAEDPPAVVTVHTTGEYVADVTRWLNEPDSQGEHDGVVEMTYTVTNRQAFRARIYALGHRVRLAEGAMRDEIIAELRSMAGGD